jgi:5'-3' exonuclease
MKKLGITKNNQEITRENLNHLDLKGAKLIGADLTRAYLTGANLTLADLTGADLIRTNLRWANLTRADLRGANLTGANLTGACLTHAYLRGADLTLANLIRTNLTGANLTDTVLDPCNDPNCDAEEFELVGDHCTGYRSRRSLFAGDNTYEIGKTYTAPFFSICDTWCHPGLYVCPTIDKARSYDADIIEVSFDPKDLHRAGNKYRRNWHATKDEPVGKAFELTINRVTTVASDHDITGIAIDSKPYKRCEIYAQYKANREPHSEQSLAQLDRVINRLKSYGYHIFAAPGAEADDVIATIATQVLEGNNDAYVTVLTGDKDLLQLVSDSCHVVNASSNQTITPELVRTKYGVEPSNIVDLLALTGDKSDNVPGVPQIGPVRAAYIINTMGSVDDILRHVDAQTPELASMKPPLLGQLLTDNVDVLRLSHNLVKLDRGLDIDSERLFAKPIPRPITGVLPATQGGTGQPEAMPAVKAPTPRSLGPKNWRTALEPQTTDQAWQVARMLFGSRLYQDYGNAEAIFATILRGRALGLDACTSLDNFHVYHGKARMSADLIVGLVLNSHKAKFFSCLETDRKHAVYQTHRVGVPTPQSLGFGLEDAKAAGVLSKDLWRKYLPNMLRHRAAVNLARLVYPDVVGGLYTPEEVE